jgi:hypothetical protein
MKAVRVLVTVFLTLIVASSLVFVNAKNVISRNDEKMGCFSQPKITMLSPYNSELFNGSFISLTFYVDGEASWMAYSVNGRDNVTINGNTTFTVFSRNVHFVNVYVKDSNGTMFSSSVRFFSLGPTWYEQFILAGIPQTVAILIPIFGCVIYILKRRNRDYS